MLRGLFFERTNNLFMALFLYQLMKTRVMEQYQATKKTVVITGASSGAGRAIALALAAKRHTLVLVARRKDPLDELVEECTTLGAKALAVVADVTDGTALQQVASTAQKWGGALDVWVNNAGLLAAGQFDHTPLEVHQKVVATNLGGYINGAYAAIPIFKEQGYGILINNISVGGWFPTPYAAAYSASKFGLTGFTQSLKGELHQWPHLHVCDLFPAFLDTPGIQHAANYTGRVLKPAPPVYDPQKVGAAVARLIEHPQPSVTIGAVTTLLKWSHAIAPGLSRRITASVIEGYLNNAGGMEPTPGNVLEPVEYGTSVHGGWSTPPTQKQKAVGRSLLALGFLFGIALLSRGR